MDDVLKEFLVESYENLDEMDQDLISLEEDPTDNDTLARVFRTLHTIKGTCGFLGFSKLESVAHVSENLLSKLRDGELFCSKEITTALLMTVDAVREILGNLESVGTEGDTDYSDLVKILEKLQVEGEGGEEEAAPPEYIEPEPIAVTPEPVAAEPAPPAPEPVAPEPVAPEPVAPEVPAAAAPPTDSFFTPPDPTGISDDTAPEDLPDAAADADAEAAGGGGDGGDGGGNGDKKGPKKPKKGKDGAGGLTESSIRVDVTVLNTLMNLVGELVLARNQILQFTIANDDVDATFLAATQRLNLITTELQEEVMKTRMQPIGNIWSKFPRVVRDLSHSLGKQVRIEMEGVDTELDKTLLEAIKDPLTHLVRNAVDHGIEMPATRIDNGKRAEGLLVLRAFHEGGMVNIEISDDGAGIDPGRIKAKALERGLVNDKSAKRMTERELVNLLFLPGFSTAEKVTNISGRGVGMDVVKNNIEKIGGTVDIQSVLGQGSTFKIKIPLTLAIIPALIVASGAERYAIPQVSLLELVRLDAKQVAEKIEMLHGAPVYRLRGQLLPLVYLRHELYPMEEHDPKPDLTVEGSIGAFNIVVLQADDRQFGLVVDKITDSQEIVVKPLGKQLQGINVFAGATIMGDGNVALILDIIGIAQKAHVVSELHETAQLDSAGKGSDSTGDTQTLLLCGGPGGQRLAIPLAIVARLEEFTRTGIETAGPQEVVQYRGEIMPLVHLSQMLPSAGMAMMEEGESDKIQVVVYSASGRSIGLVVERIIDIVEDTLEVTRESSSTGVLSSVVIQDRVTDLVDVEGVVRAFDPTFFAEDGSADPWG